MNGIKIDPKTGGIMEHDCDIKGIQYLIIDTPPYLIEDTEENKFMYEGYISGGTCSCSVCGQDAFSLALRTGP